MNILKLTDKELDVIKCYLEDKPYDEVSSIMKKIDLCAEPVPYKPTPIEIPYSKPGTMFPNDYSIID